ncbi:MAG: hypothetical protein E7584_07195 [Ruminococcaceae bacterium]|nr:hypothetical protein [Oscillospiraceae bacterium]
MKKFLLWMLILSLTLSLCSCSKYFNSFIALGLVRNQTSHSCNASFFSLNGQLVFKLKKSGTGTEGDISYSIQVDEGELYLYYDIYGTKEELAHVTAGETLTSSGGYVEGEHTVYIIIEAPQKTKGKISVELNHNTSNTDS